MDLFHIINSMEPWMIPIVVMVCLTLIIAITTTGSIIKAKINQGSRGKLSENKEFLEALREFKENMERRVANLETIVTNEEPPVQRSAIKPERKTGHGARIKDLEIEDSPADKESEQINNSKLKNMLNQ